MTVGELKERLKDIPDDLEVVLYDDEHDDYYSAGGVHKLEVSKYGRPRGLTYYKEKHYAELYREDFPTPPRVLVLTITYD